ncbi:multicopper oxidase family protein [Demequina aestuarii]|uniref:multicopper oxidase family protein n=1 Tax=Demequina aestuarii TaxID=327095 RepID=UPI000AD2B344|nr:multicopper oxidase family protein [Demequina aestuarii]
MTGPISRRQAIGLGLLGVGSLGLGIAGVTSAGFRSGVSATNVPGGAAAASWAEPAVLASSDGVLTCELAVAERPVDVGGGSARMLTYNGTVPGPTLHLRPGDTLRVRLVNGLETPTNLHTHGLVVSADGNGDNPFVSIGPGESFDYEISLPDDHPHGVFWYHPHLHGFVADQVFGGLYGAIVVDEEDWSEGAPRVVVVSDVTLSRGAVAAVSDAERRQGRVGEMVITNGLASPPLPVPPGLTGRLLLVNACTSRYLDLGGLAMTVRGLDSGAFVPPRVVDRLVLAPGSRADVLLEGPAHPTPLVARAYERGGVGMGMMGAVAQESDATILTLVPDAAIAPSAVVPPQRPPHDLRDAGIDRARTLTFTMSMGGGMRFLIDGVAFDPGRVDHTVDVGSVEEWTLVNVTMMDHPFHLHTWPMQLVDGEGVDTRDVVDVPAGESVTVRIAFDRFPGRTVYHCHVLDHEDLGMMGVVQSR